MDFELDSTKIGSRIQFYRLRNKLTQAEPTELIDTNQKHLSRIEAGYHRSSLDTIVAIAKALHIPIDSLIADYDDSADESNLKLILDDLRRMGPNQLNIPRDNIQTIKKYGK